MFGDAAEGGLVIDRLQIHFLVQYWGGDYSNRHTDGQTDITDARLNWPRKRFIENNVIVSGI